ncbi:MAG: desulfoferrodoxin [Spirochaetaceae bacterium]
MAKKLEVYKCEVCGNVVEVTNGSSGKLTCCGQAMGLLEEKTADSATEKHVPIANEGKYGVKIVVGSTNHPMTEEHYIEWIEVINGTYVNRKELKPGDRPEAEFYVPFSEDLIIRSYCNLHGLWKNK